MRAILTIVFLLVFLISLSIYQSFDNQMTFAFLNPDINATSNISNANLSNLDT
jgi:hypothetical protein